MTENLRKRVESFLTFLDRNNNPTKEELRKQLDEYNELISELDKAKVDCEHVMFIASEAQDAGYFGTAVAELTDTMKVRSKIKSVHQELYRQYSGKGIEIVGNLTYKVRVLNDLFGDELSVRKGKLVVRQNKGTSSAEQAGKRTTCVA